MSWELRTEDEIEAFALWIVDQNTVEDVDQDAVLSSIEEYFMSVKSSNSDTERKIQ